jgi:hypothetical protein
MRQGLEDGLSVGFLNADTACMQFSVEEAMAALRHWRPLRCCRPLLGDMELVEAGQRRSVVMQRVHFLRGDLVLLVVTSH